MRQNQLTLVGLLVAVFLGSQINLPSESARASAPGESKKKSPSHEPAEPVAQPSEHTAAEATASPVVSALSQTLCRLSAENNQKQAMKDAFPSTASPAPATFPTCLPAWQNPPGIHILSLMAAVEDPIHTHLGLGTDRTIDAIQAAATVAKYNSYSHFLPWHLPEAASGAGEAADHGHEIELHEPGLLIFRKDVPQADYLAVFLIPELPTTGLDQEAFFIAHKFMTEIAEQTGDPTGDPTADHIIRFAGPNFSGSMASFDDIDDVLHITGDHERQYSIHAFSGSITSPPAKAFPPHPAGVPESMLTLTQSSDRDAIKAFLNGVEEYGYCPEQVAIVTEEGTEFGNEFQQANFHQPGKDADRRCPLESGPLLLHFPREISKLRNAYGAQEGTTAPSPATTQSGAPRGDVAVNWQDPEASRGDDVPAYGGPQTPLSQQAALSSLTGILRRADIKVLGILATDPMDEAFLIRFFKKTSRDLRLFLRDPDRLYVRTLDPGSLNGTLLVSNYPLIPQNQAWSGEAEVTHEVLTLPSAIQEGEYNAFLAALENLEDPDPQLRKLGRIEWSWPAGNPRPNQVLSQLPLPPPPPLWLGTVGTSGHFPLKILPPPPALTLPIDESKLALSSLDVGTPHYLTVALWVIFATLGIVQVLGLWFPGRVPKLVTYDFYVIASTKTITASKALCHTSGVFILGLVQLILGSSFFFFVHSDLPGHWLYRILGYGVIAVTWLLGFAVFSLLIAVAAFYWKNRSDLATGELSKRPFWGMVFIVVLFGAVGGLWSWNVFRASYSNAFMHVRDLSLVSGVAPCLPLALMLVIAYLGCWAYLRRLTYWDYRRPQLPSVALDDILPSDFNSKGGKMQGIDRCILGSLENRNWRIFLGLAFVSGWLVFRPWVTIDMVETLPVRRIAWVVFSLALFFLTLNWFRFLNIWFLLRDILEDLERLPIQAAFCRMPEEKSLPILRWGVSDNSFLPPAQAVAGLRALVHENNGVLDPLRVAAMETRILALGKFKDADMKMTSIWTSLTACWRRRQLEILELPRAVNAGPAAFGRFGGRKLSATISSTPNRLVDLVQETGKSVAEMIGDLVLYLRPEYWRRGPDGSKPTDPPPPGLRKFILAEDLVALRHYNYIRYVVNELRNLLLYVAIGFSLLFLAFHVYAFRADEAIDGSLLVFFLILGGGILLVLYQMEVDPILSHFDGGKGGEVGLSFYLDLLKYGAVPALTIIGAHVPVVSNFLLRWLQPTLDSVH